MGGNNTPQECEYETNYANDAVNTIEFYPDDSLDDNNETLNNNSVNINCNDPMSVSKGIKNKILRSNIKRNSSKEIDYKVQNTSGSMTYDNE